MPARRLATRQVTFRLPVPVCLRLAAAAAVLGCSQASIVADSVTAHLDALPVKDRQLIDVILQRRQKP